MLRIRLTRVGKKRQPYYRVVVADSESKRDGRIVENIGHYNTLTRPSTFTVKEDRVLYWLSVGAQPSDTVLSFLQKRGTMKRLQRLRAGEPMEALVAEVEGPKETAKPAPGKAATAPAPVVEEEANGEAVAGVVAEAPAAETVVEEPFAGEPAVDEPVVAEAFAGAAAVEETVVEEPATEIGEAYSEAAPESVVEMESAGTEEEGEGLFGRIKDAVEDVAETVGEAAAGAVSAVRDAVEDVFEDEEE
jgi:small subunit ribosomal protein S16